jgi:hypothetical protein
MLSILKSIIDTYQHFLNDCVVKYIESLCFNVAETYVKKTSTIHTLNKGYTVYIKSLTSFIEFKQFCKHHNNHFKLNLSSKVFMKMMKNAFDDMRRTFRSQHVLKTFIDEKTVIGIKYSHFFKFCLNTFIVECAEFTEDDRKCGGKHIFTDFCAYMQTHCELFASIDVVCSVYDVYFEDAYYRLVHT